LTTRRVGDGDDDDVQTPDAVEVRQRDTGAWFSAER
jgi:hypothetical protein